MPHINCFLRDCGRRIASNQPKRSLHIPTLWPLYKLYVGDSCEETDKNQYICQKCHMKIQSQSKDPISKNFKRTQEQVVDDSLILENRTRSKRSRDENGVEVEALDDPSPPVPQPSTSRAAMNEPSTSGIIQRHEVEVPQSQPEMNEIDLPMPPPIVDSQSSSQSQKSLLSGISVSSTSSIKLRRLPGIMSVASSQKSCFICHDVHGRKRIPKQALTKVWMEKEILVPHDNRCCGSHLSGNTFTDQAMEEIVATKNGVLLSDEELAEWILDLSNICKGGKDKKRRYNFDDTTNVTPDHYPNLVGLVKTDFDVLLLELSGHLHNSTNRSLRNALAIFLMFLRHNLSQAVLCSLFGFQNQSCMSETIEAVAVALDKSFTKKNLGLGAEHLSRDAALNDHSRRMFNTLFEENDHTKLFLIMDGTYVYVEKPTDFDLQKKTFSGQKKRNLVKPFMLVLPSGYILDAAGPFFANGANNDAGILKSILANLPSDSPWLVPGDHHVLDRGFRDVIQNLQELDINTHMPSLLDKDAKQFTTKQGNHSRRVTLVRWLVEAVNGRIKKKFKFFRDTVSGGYFDRIGTFFRISCSIINRFSPPLSSNSPRHDRIAERALELVDRENTLQVRVEEERMDRNTKSWKTATANECQEFPLLSLEDFETITLGVYQTGLAKHYSARHMMESEDFDIKLNLEFENIVRAKMESRFAGNKVHNLWVEYSPGVNGAEGITGYFCRCKQGSRTLGCCSHVCAVIWYLGYQRHQIPIALKIRHRDPKTLGILDAGCEEEGESQ